MQSGPRSSRARSNAGTNHESPCSTYAVLRLRPRANRIRDWSVGDELLPRSSDELDRARAEGRAENVDPAGPFTASGEVWVPVVIEQAEERSALRSGEMPGRCHIPHCLVRESELATAVRVASEAELCFCDRPVWTH